MIRRPQAKLKRKSDGGHVTEQVGDAAESSKRQVVHAETRHRTRATRHPLIGRTVEVLFAMLDGSEQLFEGTIITVEPTGPKPVKVKFSGYGEESYAIEEAQASLVPEECIARPKSSKKRAAPESANTKTSRAAKKSKIGAHARQVRCERSTHAMVAHGSTTHQLHCTIHKLRCGEHIGGIVRGVHFQVYGGLPDFRRELVVTNQGSPNSCECTNRSI